MFLIHAKDNGLSEAVCLLEELRQMASNRQRASTQSDDALKVLRLLDYVPLQLKEISR